MTAIKCAPEPMLPRLLSRISHAAKQSSQPSRASRDLPLAEIASPSVPEWNKVSTYEHGTEEQEDFSAWTPRMPDPMEKAFLQVMAKDIVVLGVVNWGSMPITFRLAWKGSTDCLYSFLALKLCLASALQIQICRRIDMALEEQRLGPLDAGEFARRCARPSQPMATFCDVLAVGLRFMVHSGNLLLSFLEAIDPDCDAMTPGNAQQTANAKGGRKLDASWLNFPLNITSIASIGLPNLLAFSLTAVCIWQVWAFCYYYRVLWNQFSTPTAVAVYLYGLSFHLADCAGLHIASTHLKHLWMMACDPEMAAIGGDRNPSYQSRVPEMLLQGWFTVLAVASDINQGLVAILPMLVSFITSCAASIKSFYDMASIFRPWRRYMLASAKKLPHRSEVAWDPFKLAFWMTVHFTGFTLICVRFAFILWYFTSNPFDL